jgi:hypothetical protein
MSEKKSVLDNVPVKVHDDRDVEKIKRVLSKLILHLCQTPAVCSELQDLYKELMQ